MKVIQYTIEKTRGWIRIFGHGIAWKDTTKHPLLFSERLRKELKLKKGQIQLGKWDFKYLAP